MGGSGIVIVRYALVSTISRTGGSPSITIAAPGAAGAAPAATVNSNSARLAWTSVGTNKIEVRRDAFSAAIPTGLTLFVQLGSGAPVEIPSNGSWVTLLASPVAASGDHTLTYSVSFNPVSGLVKTATASVTLEYRITAN